eukprot:5859176-Ditylum_brightwellii.AAC.1
MHPMYLHMAYCVILSVYTNPCSLQGCVESSKIQHMRADNPERSTANNDITKRTWNNLGYPKDDIIGSDVDAAANAAH